ncbi:cache domain-containing protein [Curvibacter sp. CHRR-16]|uniref:cache domain-containing protein n=1 Tax=Curvibacter sp. CHRR-16 TaxID=2835872 RepID=UPI001BD98FCA|nr:cache domain-containing protein [Curvibacter sp. CHRR-16]MBT0569430.1 cache domain-containing protein [Curvibacter sp. CHRR-16]
MIILRPLLTFFAALAICFSASAQEHGTKDEAKAMVNAALAHVKKVGAEQAFKDFSTDKANWNKKDLYVFVMDMKGVMIAHGANEKLIGKNLIELKDQNGKQFIRGFVDAMTAGSETWVDYDWANPVTKKLEGKSSYLKRIPGFDGFAGVGIYR